MDNNHHNENQTMPDQANSEMQAFNSPEMSHEPTKQKELNPHSNFNKYFLYTIVGGLVISAMISVIAVLFGGFNVALGRALGTTVSMVMHTLFLLLLISTNRNTGRDSRFILNILVLIAVASFITSILAIWEIIKGQPVQDLYNVYWYSFLASLWIQLLLIIGSNVRDKVTRIITQIAIGFTVLLWLLSMPAIFTHYPDKLSEFHLRSIAATVIVLATASILTTVFHRIYLFKNPEINKESNTVGNRDIVLAVLVVVIGLPVAITVIYAIQSYNYQSNDRTYISSNDELAKQEAERKKQEELDKQRFGTDCSALGGSVAQNLIPYRTRSIVSKITTTNTSSPISTFNISLKLETENRVHAIVNSSQVKFFDVDCNMIEPNVLKEGDTVVYYMDSTNQSFAALQIVDGKTKA